MGEGIILPPFNPPINPKKATLLIMKYRLVKIGEALQEGDQVSGTPQFETTWKALKVCFGEKILPLNPINQGRFPYGYYRRPIKKVYKVIL